MGPQFKLYEDSRHQYFDRGETLLKLTFKTKNRKLLQQMRGKWDRHSFRVGILQDRPHKFPMTGRGSLRSFHGGKARKKGRGSRLSLGEVSLRFRKFLGFDFYRRPFQKSHKKSKEILKLFKDFSFFGAQTGKFNALATRRVENALQAVVRNPFLRGDYGRNTRKWAKIKGFNKLGIDTGQLFAGIKAKVY